METQMEIRTTIKNGLPIIARATIFRCARHNYETIEDLEFFWPSGCPFGPEVSASDQEEVCTTMLERDHA